MLSATGPNSRPRRILFIIGQLDVGGAERHLISVAVELKQRGWDPEIFCLTKEGVLASEVRASGIPVYSAHFLGRPIPEVGQWSLRVLGAFASLSRHLLFRRPDIVHFFLPDAYVFGGLCAWGLALRPRIMSRRSLNNYQQTRSPWLKKIEHFLHPRMTLISGNSRAVVDQLLNEGAPANRLRLIYNGVYQDRFANLPAKSATREALGIGQDSIVLVMVANIIPYKGHQLLLEALAAVRGQLPSGWHLLLIGRDDGTGTNLHTFARDSGVGEHVVWMGSRDDVPRLLVAADIGIHCSHEEGFSNAILEGMAAGLPMIVTDAGGNPEAVEHGHSGLVIPTNDARALGEAIVGLVGSPTERERLAFNAKQRVARDFGVDCCINGYEAMYSEALASKD
ncbi:MAG TPA: glycosyltransferase [Rhodocyclaceae bacterium]|nr:glycosyltransferase [Rhodocyclaceae bacterium]